RKRWRRDGGIAALMDVDGPDPQFAPASERVADVHTDTLVEHAVLRNLDALRENALGRGPDAGVGRDEHGLCEIERLIELRTERIRRSELDVVAPFRAQ